MTQVVLSDRYGGPANWPDPATVCKGPCEGMGCYPLYNPEHSDPRSIHIADAPKLEGALRTLWMTAHGDRHHVCDGWHFVTCLGCNGTGRR